MKKKIRVGMRIEEDNGGDLGMKKRTVGMRIDNGGR
jgi:hypothetical protein